MATTNIDGLRCIGDGQYHRFGSFVCYSNIQSQGQIFNYLSYPQTHPVCQRIRIQCRPTIRTHHTAIIPSQPIKVTSSKHPNIAYKSFPFLPSIPTSPINPFHFSAKQHTVTYKTFLLFEFPCSQHASNFRYDFSLFFLYKQTQNISKDMTSTSGTTNVLR